MMIRSRRVAGFVTAASLAVLLVSVGVMARRIDWYQKTQAAPLFSFAPVGSRAFEFAGRAVTITDEPMAEGAGGEGVVVRYGDDVLALPATVAPESPQLPGLARHRDWMQVLRFAERGRLSYEEFKAEVAAGRIRDRLAVVVRVPPVDDSGGRPGAGEVFRKEWVFDLYELKPEGGFAHERLGFPQKREPREGELVEGTWEFYAAMMVVPSLGRPSPRFSADALPALGWTLPGAAFSGLALTWAFASLVAPRRAEGKKR
jgi:hypothetical protein